MKLTAIKRSRLISSLKDEANGLEVTKSFIFRADSYLTDLKVKLTKNGQLVPNTKLLIGSSIGDQGVNHYNFYQVEPEGVATVNGDERKILFGNFDS